ncbi:MAG TPA: extracellular solute-binding protein [Solirubrobacterales bacterium]|nr:extracellular solute-binding protein [Solirubrobacterales bacterium]
MLNPSPFNRRPGSRPTGLLALLIAAVAAMAVAGCGGGGSATGSSGGEVDVVAYSTPETVYTDSLQPGFEATPEGEGVGFSGSFGASGDQRRAVEAGQPASLVHFAQGGDMIALEEAGLVAPNWDRNEFEGIGQESVVVLAVRKGNPEGIESFDDLLTEDVEVITPNPLSSGGARWNIMALYGSQLHHGKSEQEALDAVRTVLEKTIVQPGSARDALAAFTQGEGDVLLAYENEAIKAEEEGEDIEYVVPPSTIRIETPIAVTKDAPAAAQAFLDFIWSEKGQQIWSDNGYRPVDQSLLDEQKFPVPEDLFDIDEFGGWEKVTDEFFDEESGKVAAINEDLGVPTE